MSNIVQELEAQIRNAAAAAVSENVGTIKAIGDGVARIEGLSNAMLNEMIEFPGGVMGHMVDAVDRGVTQIEVSGGKVNLCAQRHRAVGELTGLHPAEKIE